MLLIGHPSIPSFMFYAINSIEDIEKTPPNAPLFFDFDLALSSYCKEQNLTFGLHVKNIKELVLANALGCNYFIIDKSLAINAQKVADEYFFDGKILLLSTDENDIEFVATHCVDGILFENGVKRGEL